MGMSSSQARLLSLTARQHNVEYRAQKLQAEKLQMANDSDRVYNTYLNALNATKIQARVANQWECDSFQDATLAMLEHGILNKPNETVAANTLFLQDTSTGSNCIYVTREVANKYGIDQDTTPYVGSMDDYFRNVCGLTDADKKVVSTSKVFSHNEPIIGSVASFNAIENTINSTFSRHSDLSGVIANSSNATDTTVYDNFKNKIIQRETSTLQDINNVSTLAQGQTYKITDAAGLQKLQALSRKSELEGISFILANNIDMSNINWSGIGDYQNEFKGNFDGNGYTISNLTGSEGLFGIVNGGVVKNVGLKDVNINKTNQNWTNTGTGGIAGKCKDGGLIENCYVTGSIEASRTIGGIVGENGNDWTGGTIKDCNANVTLKANTNQSATSNVGGIAATSSGVIDGCNVTGSIDAQSQQVGGILGNNTISSEIKNSSTSIKINTNETQKVGLVLGSAASTTNAKIENVKYKNDGIHNICGDKNDSDWNVGMFKASLEIPNINTTDYNGDFYQNILAAMLKAGAIDINNDTEVANLKNNVKMYVKNLYNTGSENDLFNIANINDRIYDYMKNDTTYTDDEKTAFITALQNDINSGTISETTDSKFQTTYTADKYEISQGANSGYNVISETKGQMTIPSKNTIIANIQAALKKDDASDADINAVVNYINSFDTNKQEDLAKLAYINEVITNYSKNGSNSEYVKLKKAINNNDTNFANGKLPNGVDSLDHYTIKISNINQKPTTTTKTEAIYDDVEVKDWDYSKASVQEALQKYMLQKTGIKIIDDEQARSTEWLTNMIKEGRAQFAYFNIDAAITQNADGSKTIDPEQMQIIGTSVATETSLQEVANTENVKKAEATYEKDMKKINKKETKIDTELQQCEAERSSIKTEQDSLKQVIKDNVNLTFKLFS